MAPPVDPHQAAIAELMDRASALFDAGEQLLKQGRTEEGKFQLAEALRILSDSAYPVHRYPDLATFYLNLEDDVRELEASLGVVDNEDREETEMLEPAAVDALPGINLYQIDVDPALRSRVSEDLENMRFGIPMTLNDRVVRMLDYYQNRLHDITERGLNESGKYLPMFRRVFDEEGVPQDLVHVAHVESLYKPLAFSRARAKGIWQFTRAAAKDYSLKMNRWVDERSDIEKSTRAAARYLRELYQRFGDWHIALAAYNWGPARFERLEARYGSRTYWEIADAGHLPTETANYVPSVLATILIASHPEHYGFNVQYAEPLEYEKVLVPRAVRLSDVAILLDLDMPTLKALNPDLIRQVTPRDDVDYQLKVPAGRGSELTDLMQQLPGADNPQQRYRVRTGDTLESVAIKFGVPQARLARTNRLSQKAELRPNSLLTIPELVSVSAATPSAKKPVAAAVRYRIRRGDTWSVISRRTGLSMAQLKKLNGAAAQRGLRAGQFLALRSAPAVEPVKQVAAITPGPAAPTPTPAALSTAQRIIHRVQAGETVSSIARKYGTTIKAIRSWNPVASLIHPGQQLTIFVPR